MKPKVLLTLSTILPLTLSPASAYATAPSAEPPPPELVEDPDPADASIEDIVAEVQRTNGEINKGNDAAEELAAALDQLNARGADFAGDEEVLDYRSEARLNLARAYDLDGQDELAAEAMDTAIREKLGQSLPAAKFGPDLEQLYNDRFAALDEAGWATLEVACVIPCAVYINENEVGSGPQELPPGSYRLLVESTEDRRDPLSEVIEISAESSPTVIDFGPPPKVVPPPPAVPVYKPIMPLGAEVALTVIGTGLSLTGAALIGIGSIQNVHLAEDAPSKSVLLGAGIGLLVAGVGSLATGTVTLAIDRHRAGNAIEHRAVVGWRMQF